MALYLTAETGPVEYTFDLDFFWLMTCRASFFTAGDIFRVQLLDMDEISHSSNQRSVSPFGVERSVWRWFLPAVFLSLCWVPLGRVSKFNELRGRQCKDRKATSYRRVSQSITWQRLHFAWVQAHYFFISSSFLLYPQTFLLYFFPYFILMVLHCNFFSPVILSENIHNSKHMKDILVSWANLLFQV